MIRSRIRDRLREDQSGVALIEFAFTLPFLMLTGIYGLETANLAIVNLRVSQIALNLADDASRVGNTPLTTQQMREVDVNDVLQAARYQGSNLNLTTRGRVIISSLENVQQSYDTAAVQRIHWQRCIGTAKGTGYDSSYGVAGTTPTTLASAGSDASQANAGQTQSTGMGDTGAKVNAPAAAGVIFVEVNYNYKPLFSGYLIGNAARIHYVASFIVRDNRDFSRIWNPSPASTPSTCDKYAS